MKSTIIPEEYAGQRLDKALLLLFPETSLRHRRRLISSWDIRVDGVVRGPAYKVRAGETLTAAEPAEAEVAAETKGASIHAVSRPWATLYKPAGLDSETLAGGARPGLDRLCAELDAQTRAAENAASGQKEAWQLVSRLDRDVSGLVAAAQGAEAVARFRTLEGAGEVGKTYLLLAAPENAAEFPAGSGHVVKKALDMANRRQVRALEADDPDPARWTRFTVLGPLRVGDEEVLLVQANIARGARHQIRVHAAAAGLPIVGDPVYGAGDHPTGILFLHCAGLRIENFETEAPPPWGEALGSEYERCLALAGMGRQS
ncbi:pseudouridine synthase [Oceanidesulfovibrio marinus]|uniref:RNA pseudouridine synthase n=1 Tax=Oceanidesulfovibrio marinus TaxID=370038 RepID=A0A6P1ZNP6_9BACT|nr:pseudouridine synthase [Oceanidesulfovibrio marinus]TVM35928.1 RNA pseudouridine synthase [Oceanidesulfovibrio marinus]